MTLVSEGKTYAATLSQYGATKMLSDEGEWLGDFAWFGRETAFMLGAVENPVEVVRGTLQLHRDNTLIHEDEIEVFDGCKEPVFLHAPTKPRYDKRDNKLIQWLTAHGPEELDLVRPALENAKRWFPEPDPNDAGATGSSRVVENKCIPALAIVLLPDADHSDLLLDSQRSLRDQLDRAYHYYYAEEGYRPWSAGDGGVVGIYRGPGGFNASYTQWDKPEKVPKEGTKEWDEYSEHVKGRTWGYSGGRNPPDHEHLAVEQLVWIAVLTKSWLAMRSAVAAVEQFMSQQRVAKFNNVRSEGWGLAGIAICHFGLSHYTKDVGHFVGYARDVLETLEAKNYSVEGVEVVVPSRFASWECGHMCSAQSDFVRNTLNFVSQMSFRFKEGEHGDGEFEELIVTKDKNAAELCRGTTVFMAGIGMRGVTMVVDMLCEDDLELLKLATRQQLVLATFLVAATRPWLHYKTGEVTDLSNGVFQGDLSPYGLAKPEKDVDGVVLRFTVPGVLIAIRLFRVAGHHAYADRLEFAVEAVVKKLEKANYWGQAKHPDKGRAWALASPLWELLARRDF